MIKTMTTLFSKLKLRLNSERGEIGDSFMLIIGIGLSVVLIFVFPLMTMADRTDDVSQLAVQSATSEFAEKVRKTGKISQIEYNKFIETISATGNTYDVNMTVQVEDINIAKKQTSSSSYDKIGENTYYSVYKSQIEEVQAKNNGVYLCGTGDIFTVEVKNTSKTIGQQFKDFFYNAVGNDAYVIAAEETVVILVDGK
ncbi:MAG: hypothetical protein HUJ68_00930 [Clostridia bacterium]|nr:hypothetical protein [Clostridia bacterium]